MLHFIGFRGEEYWNAVKVWGLPDFIHRWHDYRMYGEVAEGDILVFGPKATPDYIEKYSDQDHERF